MPTFIGYQAEGREKRIARFRVVNRAARGIVAERQGAQRPSFLSRIPGVGQRLLAAGGQAGLRAAAPLGGLEPDQQLRVRAIFDSLRGTRLTPEDLRDFIERADPKTLRALQSDPVREMSELEREQPTPFTVLMDARRRLEQAGGAYDITQLVQEAAASGRPRLTGEQALATGFAGPARHGILEGDYPPGAALAGRIPAGLPDTLTEAQRGGGRSFPVQQTPFSSVVPSAGLDAATSRVPGPFRGPARRSLEFLTSPVAGAGFGKLAMSQGFLPAARAFGVGEAAAITGGGALEAANVPTPAQYGGEALLGMMTGIPTLPGVRRAAAAALRRPTDLGATAAAVTERGVPPPPRAAREAAAAPPVDPLRAEYEAERGMPESALRPERAAEPPDALRAQFEAETGLEGLPRQAVPGLHARGVTTPPDALREAQAATQAAAEQYLRRSARTANEPNATLAARSEPSSAPAAAAAAVEEPAVVRQLEPNERISPADRDVIRVRPSQIEARPELFQTRDVSVEGPGVGARRVQELVDNWDWTRFKPARIVANPEVPGRYIVRDGHHRLEAARRVLAKEGRADEPLPMIFVEGDIRDPQVLNRMRLEAVTSNFSRAEMNIREQARSVEALAQAGQGADEIAGQLRMKVSQVEDLQDMSRLGEGVMERVVAEPTLAPIAAEIGKAMRLYGLDAENADALFRRFATPDAQNRVITRTALRQTLKKFAPQMQNAMFGDLGDAGGSRGGVLGMFDELTKKRAALEAQRRQLNAAVRGSEMLGERTGKKGAAQQLVAAGQREVKAVEREIKALERELMGELRGAQEAPRPAPAPSAGSEAALPSATSRGEIPLEASSTQEPSFQTSTQASVPSPTMRATSPPSRIEGPRRTAVDLGIPAKPPSRISLANTAAIRESGATLSEAVERDVRALAAKHGVPEEELRAAAYAIQEAERIKPQIDAIYRRVGGDAFYGMGPAKKLGRIAEKMAADGRPADHISDYLRGRFVAEPEELERIVRELQGELGGRQMDAITDAQRANLLAIDFATERLGGNVSVETQFFTPEHAFIQGFMHEAYDLTRAPNGRFSDEALQGATALRDKWLARLPEPGQITPDEAMEILRLGEAHELVRAEALAEDMLRRKGVTVEAGPEVGPTIEAARKAQHATYEAPAARGGEFTRGQVIRTQPQGRFRGRALTVMETGKVTRATGEGVTTVRGPEGNPFDVPDAQLRDELAAAERAGHVSKYAPAGAGVEHRALGDQVNVNDRIVDTQKREWTVIATDDPSVIGVRSDEGVTARIGRQTVLENKTAGMSPSASSAAIRPTRLSPEAEARVTSAQAAARAGEGRAFRDLPPGTEVVRQSNGGIDKIVEHRPTGETVIDTWDGRRINVSSDSRPVEILNESVESFEQRALLSAGPAGVKGAGRRGGAQMGFDFDAPVPPPPRAPAPSEAAEAGSEVARVASQERLPVDEVSDLVRFWQEGSLPGPARHRLEQRGLLQSTASYGPEIRGNLGADYILTPRGREVVNQINAPPAAARAPAQTAMPLPPRSASRFDLEGSFDAAVQRADRALNNAADARVIEAQRGRLANLRGILRDMSAVDDRGLRSLIFEANDIVRAAEGARAGKPRVPQMGDKPPPQFGSTQKQFMGEQGGVQARAFAPEEVEQRGQLGLEDMAVRGEALAPPPMKGGAPLTMERLEELRARRNVPPETRARGQYAEPPNASDPLASSSKPHTDAFEEWRRAGRSDAVSPYIAARIGETPTQPEGWLARWIDSPYGARTTREAWRKYDGSLSGNASDAKLWGAERYGEAQQQGFPIRPRSDRQSDAVISIDEGIFDGPGKMPAGYFKPKERKFVQALYDEIQRHTSRILALDPSFKLKLIPSYFPHLFVQVNKGTKALNDLGVPVVRRLGYKPGFYKKRKLQGSLAEILEANPHLDLRTWDPVEWVKLYGQEVDRHIATEIFRRRLDAAGLVLRDAFAPDDWVRVNHPAFMSKTVLAPPGTMDEVTRFYLKQDMEELREVLRHVPAVGYDAQQIQKALGQMQTMLRTNVIEPAKLIHTQPYRVEPTAAAVLNNWAKKSELRSNVFTRQLIHGVATAKMVKVFGGIFQQLDYTKRVIDGIAVGQGDFRALNTVPRAWRRMVDTDFDMKVLRQERQASEIIEGERVFIRRDLENEGLSANVDPDISLVALEEVGQELLPIPVLKQLLTIGSRSYGRFHREMLMGAGEALYRGFRRDGMNHQEAIVRAVERTNEFFSSTARWQSVFQNPTTRDIIRILAFAIGEFEGWARITGRAISPKFATKEGIRFLAGLYGMTFVYAQMINLATTGHLLDSSQLMPFRIDRDQIREFKERGPGAIMGTDLPFIDYNTTFFRPEAPWKGPLGRIAYIDLLGQVDTPLRFIFDPVFAIQSRLGQAPSMAASGAAMYGGGKPLWGPKPETATQKARWWAEQFSPIPLTAVAGEERGRIGAIGAGTQLGGVNVSAEGLRDLLKRRFEEVIGKKFNPETDYDQARRHPELAEIIKEMGRYNVAYGTESGIARQQREAVQTEQAQSLFLNSPDMLAGVRRGDSHAGEEFMRRYSDWQKAAAGAAAAAYALIDRLPPESEGGRLVDQLHNLDPYAPEWRSEDGYGPDWGAWGDRRDEIVAKIDELEPGFAQSYEEKLRLPEELQDIEAKMRRAKNLRSELGEISPIYGIDADFYRELSTFWRYVDRARDEWRRGGQEVSQEDAIPFLAQNQGRPANFAQWALALRPGSSERDQRRNGRYLEFLRQHEGELRLFYPSLYSANYVIDYIREMNRREPVAAGAP